VGFGGVSADIGSGACFGGSPLATQRADYHSGDHVTRNGAVCTTGVGLDSARLNPAQREAVDHRGGPLLVLAGAGTGKTRVITHRVAALVEEGVAPWKILAVTFTNKAAGEMRERIGELCSSLGEDVRRAGMWVGTFHSTCARILRRHGQGVGLSERFSIYDVSDQRSLMKRVLSDLNVSDRLYTPRGVLGHIDQAKNQGLGPHELHRVGLVEPMTDVVRRAWETYEARLRAADAADFGDLLTLSVRLLEQAPMPQDDAQAGRQLAEFDEVVRLRRRFEHVVVDEFQDTNPVQARLVDLLATRAELCVVGDDDQSIYGWRGADVAQILSFPDRHRDCKVIRLEQNYRSTTHILDCADAIIRKNRSRHGKKLWSDLGEGEPVSVVHLPDERAEARFVAQTIAQGIADGISAEAHAVFYRTHAQSRALETALREADLAYRIVGGTRFFDRTEIKDLIAYLRLMITPNSDVDLARVINRPARRIGNKTVDTLASYAASAMISMYDAMSHVESAGLGKAAAGRVKKFRDLMDELRVEAAELSLDQMAQLVLERTGYLEALAADDSVESDSRLENLQEFLGALAEYAEDSPDASLAEYLELVSLSTTDDEGDPAECVTLMTVHSAKGLEFERVLLTGMEERVFPHARALEAANRGEFDEMEEERRLAYVAVTRAKRELFVTRTARRFIYGADQVNAPSRFMGELPATSIAHIGRKPGGHLAGMRPAGGGGSGRLAWTEDPRPEPAPAQASWDDDIDLDPEFDASEGVSVFVGMHVRHAKFGVGEVAAWSGVGQDMKLTLRFPGKGTKTILARFCEPA